MAVRVWSMTITDDEARVILNLVDASTGQFQEVQAWYVDDDRNYTFVDTEDGPAKQQIRPVFQDRRAAFDFILENLISTIDPT